jgi:hypothetical protein
LRSRGHRLLGGHASRFSLQHCSGAIRSDFTRPAVVAEVFFMLGLAGGRLVSLIADGVPSTMLTVSTALEIVMGICGILVLKKLSSTSGGHDLV